MSGPARSYTFLFTDLEGSSRLWEEDPAAMGAALAWHDALLRETIEARSGRVFKAVGDGICAVFTDAGQALSAALAAQCSFAERSEPGGPVLRVRMALHTGVAESRDGDFFGPTLNRVARLLRLGHGGQVLLSGAARAHVGDALPAGASLQDLGSHTLKDLAHAEHVHQLCHPRLQREFPTLRSPGRLPSSWPQNVSSFVGREREVTEVTRLLRDARLVTLTGPGGIGKTRLAVRAAEEAVESYPDGGCFVALAELDDSALVGPTIARALGVREEGGQDLAETIVGYLQSRNILLLLDNFEHVLDAAGLVSKLIRLCPRLTVLVTSRTPLHLYGEREFSVPSLESPQPEQLASPESLSHCSAVQLFAERARAVRADFSLTAENAAAVADICSALDGLPLAIELAAARIRILSPQAILTRLGNRLQLLTGGAQDLPARQRTLRGAIEWGYDLLSAEERTLFWRMSIFQGGCTLEAAESVCRVDGEPPVLDAVESLVEKSMISASEGVEGQPRFRMLETLREFARERLEESGEAEGLHRAHAEFFLSWAEEASPKLRGSALTAWCQRLEEEHDNFRAGLRWAHDRGDAEIVLRLTGALARLWNLRGHIVEGHRWVNAALGMRVSGGDTERWRGELLIGATRLAASQGDLDGARGFAEEALRLFQASGDPEKIAKAFQCAGGAAWRQRDFGAAREHLERSLSISRELEDAYEIANTLNDLGALALTGPREYDEARACFTESLSLGRQLAAAELTIPALTNLGVVAFQIGELAEARKFFEEGVLTARTAGLKHFLADLLHNLGSVVRDLGDPVAARGYLEEGCALHREMADGHGLAYSLHSLGSLALRTGDLESAESLLREGLRKFHEFRIQAPAVTVVDLAELALARGQLERAVRLLSVASRWGEITGVEMTRDERMRFQRLLTDARARAGDGVWRSAWAMSSSLDLNQAITFALSEKSTV